MENIFGALFSLYRGTPRHGECVIACLQGAWPKLLGGNLARVCRPASFGNRILVVEVLDPQWEDAVKSVASEMLEKLRSATAGEVLRISVVSRQPTVDSSRP